MAGATVPWIRYHTVRNREKMSHETLAHHATCAVALQLVVDFLGPRDVCRFAACSRACSAECSNEHRWRNLYRSDFSVPISRAMERAARLAAVAPEPNLFFGRPMPDVVRRSLELVGVTESGRELYKRAARLRASRLRELLAVREHVCALTRVNTHANVLRTALDVLYFACMPTMPCASLLLFLVLLCLYIDGRMPGLTLAHVCTPVYAALAFTIAGLCVGAAHVQICVGGADENAESMWYQQVEANDRSIVGVFTRHMERNINPLPRRRLRVLYMAAMCTCASLLPITLTLRAMGVGSMASVPWSVAFLPLWAMAALFPCIMFGCGRACRSSDSCCLTIMFHFLFLLPSVLFAALLSARLDGGLSSRYLLLAIPVLLLGGVAALGMVGVMLFTCRRLLRQRQREHLHNLLWSCGIFLPLCALITGVALVAQWADTVAAGTRPTMSFTAAATPLIILAGMILLGSIGAAVHMARRARNQHYKGAWTCKYERPILKTLKARLPQPVKLV